MSEKLKTQCQDAVLSVNLELKKLMYAFNVCLSCFPSWSDVCLCVPSGYQTVWVAFLKCSCGTTMLGPALVGSSRKCLSAISTQVTVSSVNSLPWYLLVFTDNYSSVENSFFGFLSLFSFIIFFIIFLNALKIVRTFLLFQNLMLGGGVLPFCDSTVNRKFGLELITALSDHWREKQTNWKCSAFWIMR